MNWGAITDPAKEMAGKNISTSAASTPANVKYERRRIAEWRAYWVRISWSGPRNSYRGARAVHSAAGAVD